METVSEKESIDLPKEPVSTQKNPAPSRPASTVGSMAAPTPTADKPAAKANGLTDQTVADDRETVKALLAEARNTKEVLEDFQIAVQNGTFKGHAHMAIAKGLSFLAAVIAQNKAHIDNLQGRMDKKA